MIGFIKKYKYRLLLYFFVLSYIIYFSFFTILRYRTLYASYFDLGIMHQTVFNTYKAIVEKDPGRFLELTNPFGGNQIKRMAIHNDLLLAFLAPLYFIYSGPETLLVLQSVVLGLGALAIFGIARKIFANSKQHELMGLIFSFAYLFYSPMQRSNIFDFHAVTFSTSFLLFMFYLWLDQRYVWSGIFFLLSLLSKEQVALTTLFFGSYFFTRKRKSPGWQFSLMVIALSAGWFLLSMWYIIPLFRGEQHFALPYYGDFGEKPIGVIMGIFRNPYSIVKYVFHIDSLRYFIFLLGPLGFLSLLSPLQLLIALPEFAINLLSNNWNMRNIIFHYTAVIQPFVFISSIYGARVFARFKIKKLFPVLLLAISLVFSYFKGPLLYSREAEIHPFLYPQKERSDVFLWSNILKDETIKVSTTGQLAPFFTSRRYFYIFSQYYYLADYIIARPTEIALYPGKELLIPVYEKLKKDSRYTIIYLRENFEVYKKI